MKTVKDNARFVLGFLIVSVMAALLVVTLAAESEKSNPASEIVLAGAVGEGGAAADAPKGSCLAPDLPAAKVDELTDSVLASGADDAYANSAIAPISLPEDELRSVVGFDVALPQAPEGWLEEVTLVSLSGHARPLKQCLVRAILTDPAVTETKVIPEEMGVDEGGNPMTLGGRTIEFSKEARVEVYPAQALDPGIVDGEDGGREVSRSSVNGIEAVLVTTRDDKTVGIGFILGNATIDVSCRLMSVEECVAIAESVR